MLRAVPPHPRPRAAAQACSLAADRTHKGLPGHQPYICARNFRTIIRDRVVQASRVECDRYGTARFAADPCAKCLNRERLK
jgi:hypothetical protein